MTEEWPELPYAAWKESCTTLQLWTQIVGKTRLALTPWLNHSWHVSFRVTARGLGTPLIHAGPVSIQIEFDFIDHRLLVRTSNGDVQSFPLRAMPVAEFYKEFLDLLSRLGIDVRIDGTPNEVVDAIPFRDDQLHRAYDPEFANRFWRVLLVSHEVFSRFRTGFLGKASPVHFFWGSFDLAVTRFSGRSAPLHPGGFPHMPDRVVREAYSHEVSSAGFWPGGGPIEYAAYYSYAYPTPDSFARAEVGPAETSFNSQLGEFILAYDAVRRSSDPKRHLMKFLQSTYEAAAIGGQWDRSALECALGEPGRPRLLG